MLLKRVIPCLDVDRGRVVKGTNFVDIRDAGDLLRSVSIHIDRVDTHVCNRVLGIPLHILVVCVHRIGIRQ